MKPASLLLPLLCLVASCRAPAADAAAVEDAPVYAVLPLRNLTAGEEFFIARAPEGFQILVIARGLRPPGAEDGEPWRVYAAEAIETAVSGKQVPAAIRKLLGEVWLDKLMFIYLREPEAGHVIELANRYRES